MKYLKEIRDVCETLRDRVYEALRRGQAAASSSGATIRSPWARSPGLAQYHPSASEKVGLIWFDAHADCQHAGDAAPAGTSTACPSRPSSASASRAS